MEHYSNNLKLYLRRHYIRERHEIAHSVYVGRLELQMLFSSLYLHGISQIHMVDFRKNA